MRALLYDKTLRYSTDYPEPIQIPGEALIKVKMAGICNTDIEIVKGYMGFTGILGHEFVGIVEESNDPDWIGQRVVGEINAACGICPMCLEGNKNHCPKRTVLGIQGRDGVFADYVSLPITNLHRVPEEIPDTAAVFVEPTAAAYEVLTQLQVLPTDRVLVLGDGKLGLIMAQVLESTGCHLTAIGKHPEKLGILASRGIMTACIDNGLSDPIMTCLAGADVVVDCTGSPSGLDIALRLIRPRGTLVIKSTYAEPTLFNPSPIVVNELTVIGSRCGPFKPALRALSEGFIATEPLIEAIYPLQKGLEAIAHATKRGAKKVLLRM